MKMKAELFLDQHKCTIDTEGDRRRKLSFTAFLRFLRYLILPWSWNWKTRAHYHTPRSLQQEKIRQIHKHRRVIHPFSIFSFTREMVVFIVLLFKLFTNDFGYVFFTMNYNCGYVPCYQICMTFTYGVLYMDMIFLFRTGYIEKNTKHVQLDSKKIARKYIRSTFILDFITSFPYIFVFEWFRSRLSQPAYLFLHFMEKIILVFNIIRTFIYYHSIGQTFGVSKRVRNLIWSVLFLIILTAAINPFLFIIAKRIQQFYQRPRVPDQEFYMDMPGSIIYDLQMYHQGFFLSLISLGQRGNRAIKTFDIIMLIKIFLVAINLFGYILLLANIVIAYQNWWSMKLKYYEWYYKVRNFIQRNKVSKKNSNNLFNMYRAKYFNDYHWDRRILWMLGDSITKAIETDRCRKFFGKQPIMRFLSEEEMQLVGSLLEEESYLKDEVVFNINTPGDAMYYFSSGRAVALRGDGTVAAEYGTGDYFGEVALMAPETRRTVKLVTTDICYFLVLSKYNFSYILNMIGNPLEIKSDYFVVRRDFTTALD